MKVFRVELALKPRLLSKDLASQSERHTPQRDVNQLGNVCLGYVHSVMTLYSGQLIVKSLLRKSLVKILKLKIGQGQLLGL